MRFTDEGSVCEPQAGYTFYWNGKAESEERIHSLTSYQDIPDLPMEVNECLMKLFLPISSIHHLTIFSAYARNLTSSGEDKEKFYEDVDRLVKSTLPVTVNG